MLKRLLLLLAVVAAVLGTPAVASAHSAPRADCSSHCWTWGVQPTGGFDTYGYSEAKWTANVPPYQYLQDRSHCKTTNTTAYYTYSGVVRTVGLWGRATCNKGDAIIQGAVKFEINGTWGPWQGYWTGAVRRGCAINVKVTHGTNTTNAKIIQGCGEKISAWELFAGNPNPQDGPWKTSGTSTAWRNTGVSPVTGGYRRMNNRGTVFTITTF